MLSAVCFVTGSCLSSSPAALHVLGWKWKMLCLLLLPQAKRAKLVQGFWSGTCYVQNHGPAYAECCVLCPA